jgi:raffinose/stachyose/melibiose transport system substrate-binding protein
VRKQLVKTTVGLALATTVVAGVFVAGSATTPASAQDQARKPAAAQAQKKATVKVWDVQYFPRQSGSAGALGRAMELIDKAFMKKYPNVKVDHVGVPGSQFITSMRTFVASRKGPDVVTNGGGAFPVNSGFAKAMRPMYDLLTKQQKIELSPYLEDEGIGDEAHYAVPVQAHVYMFYYNKAMFAKAGIKQPPQTFQALLSACTALKNAGITPISNGWAGTGGNIPWNYGIASQVLSRSALIAWANRKIGWNDARFARGLGYLQQLASAGCFGDRATAATQADTEGISAFQGGRGAMLFWNVLDTSTFGAPVGGVNNVGVFAFPKVPTSVYPAGTPDSGYNANWSLMNYSKNCRAAWNYISFTLSKEAQAIMWRVGRTLPVNRFVKVKGSNPVENGILALAANKYGHTGIGATMSAQEAALQERLLPLLINGSLSPENMVSQMQAERDKLEPLAAPGPLPKPPPCK